MSSCLAVSQCFVPQDYVTTIKAFKRGRKKRNALLLKRKSMTTIEFVGCDLSFNRHGSILSQCRRVPMSSMKPHGNIRYDAMFEVNNEVWISFMWMILVENCF